MARECEICKKKRNLKTQIVKLRGKFNPTTKRKQKPNLQWVKLPSGKRVLACVKCAKTLAKKGNIYI